VEQHVAVLVGRAAVPSLEQIGHHHGHLAELAAEKLLELSCVHRVGTLGPGVVLQLLDVEEHGRRLLWMGGWPMRWPPGSGTMQGPGRSWRVPALIAVALAHAMPSAGQANGRQPADDVRAREAYRRAIDLEAGGDHDAALALLWTASGLAPRDAAIQARLA